MKKWTSDQVNENDCMKAIFGWREMISFLICIGEVWHCGPLQSGKSFRGPPGGALFSWGRTVTFLSGSSQRATAHPPRPWTRFHYAHSCVLCRSQRVWTFRAAPHSPWQVGRAHSSWSGCRWQTSPRTWRKSVLDRAARPSSFFPRPLIGSRYYASFCSILWLSHRSIVWN